MRSFLWWILVVHLTFLSLVPDRALAAPPLTTVQDTLYKADGTRFNGVAYIEWNSFQASDSSAVAASSVVVPIVDGALRVRLIPTSTASAGAHYFVRYHAEGRVQFTETWNVIPSVTPVPVSAVRVPTGAVTGGGSAPPAALAINDITGLADELAARPVKGFAYASDRILKSGPTGAIEAVQGNLSDCIRVDGTTGACGSGGGTSGGPGFIDQETPAGNVNGSNTVFSLAQAPDPASSLAIYRNGILQKTGVDYSLSGTTVTFGSLSIPQTGDLLLASYRTAGSGTIAGPLAPAEIGDGAITNVQVSATAGIAESKLALQHPTHSNANDPSANEKAALGGTAGAPSGTNKFVTNADSRLTNARPPQAHALLGDAHSDTAAGGPQRGDLVYGSAVTGAPKWGRLPLGGANRCLTSNGVDAVWNTCLYTGFAAGAVPFMASGGILAEAPMHFTWDNSNRRLSVGSNLNTSTLTVHDSSAGGSTTLTVRGGMQQGQNVLQVWQNSSGIEQASIGADGVFAAESIETTSSAQRAAWRESGTATDPAVRSDGDAWYNTSAKTRRSVEAGQVHGAPQVICAATGASSDQVTLVLFGSCAIPAGLLGPGDRLQIRATWIHDGTADYLVRWRWGGATVDSETVAGSANLLDQKGEVALYDGSAVIDGASRGSAGYSSGFVEASPELWTGGLTIGFEGNVTASGETLRLAQFTVVRLPAQSNP